ncbi:macrophage mannose receptor 1-like isoform X3 [Spea bombifrons]|uniref:macrophage mannose receptor 1-like isoform X3 n=1 Tax=Spea bombifrons TaxID=233779 RepID=UPI00234BB133|nr:macrophage mannose receptor 1-like isoform X3 [Spea bombifrons]
MSLDTEQETSWILNVIERTSPDPVGNNTGYWLMGDEVLTASACPVITPAGQRISRGCHVPSFFVCEGKEGALIRCPAGPRWQHWRGSCYYVERAARVTWRDARLTCNSYKETRLLYLTSAEEMVSRPRINPLRSARPAGPSPALTLGLLQDAVSSMFEGSAWTGLNDLNVESVFRWTAGEEISAELSRYLRNDMADGGLKDCVEINTVARILTDSECNERKPFICKCPEVCAHGISGNECLKPPRPLVVPSCHCSGSIATSLGVVCGVPVADCIEWCLKQKLQEDCRKCVPACPDQGAGIVAPDEVSLISVMEQKAGRFLLRVAEGDTEPHDASRSILYHAP